MLVHQIDMCGFISPARSDISMWPHSNDLTSPLNLDAYIWDSCVNSWLLSLFLAHSWSLHPPGQWQSLCALCVSSRHGGQSQTVSSGEMVYYRGRHTQEKLQRSPGLQTNTWRFPRELALRQSPLSFAWLRHGKRLLPKAVAISPSYKHRLHRKLLQENLRNVLPPQAIQSCLLKARLSVYTVWSPAAMCAITAQGLLHRLLFCGSVLLHDVSLWRFKKAYFL